jgi:hypothetical protein
MEFSNRPFFTSFLKSSISVLSIIAMFSCGNTETQNDPQNETPQTSLTRTAVVATGIWGSGGAHSLISYKSPREAQNDFLPTGSDLRMSSYGKFFYRIEDSNSHSVTKFSIDDPSTPIWQFSTEGTETNSYPYSIVFVNETKAYLIRNGSPKIWIINPSATTELEFKIGEINLSSYNNCDDLPEATSGVIVGNKLFVTLQRLCNWHPTDPAYLAVFNTDTDDEINTGMGSGGLLGIKLDVRNPGGTYGKIKYYNGYIYVAGADGLFGNNNIPILGGVQRINTTDYTKSGVLESDRQITGLEIISDTKGYFIQYNSWENNSLVSFDPQTWAIEENVAGIGTTGDRNLIDITKDYDGMLWLADASLTNPGIYIIDTTTDTIQEGPIFTNLNPLEIAFCEK